MHGKRELTNHSSLCNSLVPQALVHGPVNMAIYGIIYIHEVMMHDKVVSTSLALRSHAAFIASFHALLTVQNKYMHVPYECCFRPGNEAGVHTTFAGSRASVVDRSTNYCTLNLVLYPG